MSSVETGNQDALRHTAAAMGYSDDGDSEGASRRHLAAAKVHESAGTDAMRNGDGAGAETHYTAADLHRRAASMHSAGIPIENDDDEDDDEDMEEELTGNLTMNYGGDDPLPQPGLIASLSSPPVRNRRGTGGSSSVVSMGDTLDTPTVILHNIGFGNALDERGAGSQAKMHSWDGGLGGSVEKGGVNLGRTAGNPQFGDRIDPRTMTPEEFLEEALRHDEVNRENRRRQGLPEGDMDTDELLLEAPGAIGTILGEHRTIKK
jgi:hypothetical protein